MGKANRVEREFVKRTNPDCKNQVEVNGWGYPKTVDQPKFTKRKSAKDRRINTCKSCQGTAIKAKQRNIHYKKKIKENEELIARIRGNG